MSKRCENYRQHKNVYPQATGSILTTEDSSTSDTLTARRYRRETNGVQVPWPYLSVRGPSRRSGLCREVQAQVTLNDRCKAVGRNNRELTSAS
jgi:hypothetical protein